MVVVQAVWMLVQALLRRFRRRQQASTESQLRVEGPPADAPTLADELRARRQLPWAARLAIGRDGVARYEGAIDAGLESLRRVENPPHLTPQERYAALMPRIEAMRADGRMTEERYQEMRRFLEEGVERAERGESWS